MLQRVLRSNLITLLHFPFIDSERKHTKKLNSALHTPIWSVKSVWTSHPAGQLWLFKLTYCLTRSSALLCSRYSHVLVLLRQVTHLTFKWRLPHEQDLRGICKCIDPTRAGNFRVDGLDAARQCNMVSPDYLLSMCSFEREERSGGEGSAVTVARERKARKLEMNSGQIKR